MAQKINNNKEKVAYVKYQKSMNHGLCFLCFSFDFGVYLDFLDSYLRYEEIVSENKCIHNSLIDQISTSENIIRKEMAQLLELLSGKKLPDGKPNC